MEQGIALIFPFRLELDATHIMAMSSFHLYNPLALESYLTQRGLTVRKCVMEDSDVSQNKRENMR